MLWLAFVLTKVAMIFVHMVQHFGYTHVCRKGCYNALSPLIDIMSTCLVAGLKSSG